MLRTIETTRLTLRPFRETDARRIAYLAGDYDVAKMCGRVPHPYPVAAAHTWLAKMDQDRDSGAEFPFAIEARIDGLIGACGVMRVGDPNDATWEIGYWLGIPYWGFGYAVEASRALMGWARDTLGAKVFTAGHFVDNPASGKVLRKLGFSHAGSAELFGLARQQTAPCERYVWPEGAVAANLANHHGAHHPH
jgi:[ribosomal protein S5]-alanine N-acetyltransferase